MTTQIGSRVLVKDNAFGNSTNPEDIAARGKFGKKVVWILDDERIEVQTDDDDFLPLTVDEVEEVEEVSGE